MRALVFIIIAGLLVLVAVTVAYGRDGTAARNAASHDTAALFQAGMEALGAAQAAPDREARDGKLDEAIAAFRAILVNRPELVRVRLELAPRLLPEGGRTGWRGGISNTRWPGTCRPPSPPTSITSSISCARGGAGRRISARP